MNIRYVICLLFVPLLWSCGKTKQTEKQLEEAGFKIEALRAKQKKQEKEIEALEADREKIQKQLDELREQINTSQIRRASQIDLLQRELSIRYAWDDTQIKAIEDHFLREKAEEHNLIIRALTGKPTHRLTCGHTPLVNWITSSEKKNKAADEATRQLLIRIEALVYGGKSAKLTDEPFPYYLPAFGIDEKTTKAFTSEWEDLQACRRSLN